MNCKGDFRKDDRSVRGADRTTAHWRVNGTDDCANDKGGRQGMERVVGKEEGVGHQGQNCDKESARQGVKGTPDINEGLSWKTFFLTHLDHLDTLPPLHHAGFYRGLRFILAGQLFHADNENSSVKGAQAFGPSFAVPQKLFRSGISGNLPEAYLQSRIYPPNWHPHKWKAQRLMNRLPYIPAAPAKNPKNLFFLVKNGR